MAIPYSYNGLSFGSNLGLTSTNPWITDFKPALIDAQKKSVDTGNKNWQKVLDAILKYGGSAITILSNAGVLKNRNLESLTSGDIDKQALNELLYANGGSLDKNPNNLIQPNSRSAIDLSSPVVLGVLAGLAYLLLKK